VQHGKAAAAALLGHGDPALRERIEHFERLRATARETSA
jgi:hypothetical protein